MSKHTPGPWITGPIRGSGPEGSMVVYGPGSPVELQIADFRPLWEYRITREEAEGNACLIAAAPELLAACKAILDLATEKETPRDAGWILFQRLLKESDAGHAVRAAIAKAENRR